MDRICMCCGRLFRPYPTVPDQRYCSRRKCQRARRRLWQRKKLASDKSYRENQADAQRVWRQRNRDYWKRYRNSHPEYVKRNRELQRERNRRRRGKSEGSECPDVLAKMDVLTTWNNDISGYYRLVPLGVERIAKMDELVVRLDVITGSYPQGP